MTRSAGASPSGPSPEATERPAIRALLAGAAAQLTAAGVETPRLDAELLLAHVLGGTRERLILDAHAPLDAGAGADFDELVRRRAAREPVAYLLATKPFRRLELHVDPRVLIPRPETELLVEVGLELPAGARVVDVGTGSGAVALALADERPDLEVWATERSAGALSVARENAARLGLGVHFAAGDLLAAAPGPFAAVLANLPYVADDEALPPEVGVYEPAEALYGGPDGLAVIRRLAEQLEPATALVALEVGAGQADAVGGLLAGVGFPRIELRRDLAGHDRVVVGRR